MFYMEGVKNELKVPEVYDYYGYYGHEKRKEISLYEKVHDKEYGNWSFSSRISNWIREEVNHCRNECAIFDLTSFGKVLIYNLGFIY